MSAANDEENALRASLEDSVCRGACSMLSMCSFCCAAGFIVPIICVVFLATEDEEDNSLSEGEEIVLLVAALFGFIFGVGCCFSLFHPIILNEKPMKPDPLYPLTTEPSCRKPTKCYVLVNPKGGTAGARATYNNIVKPKLDAAGIAHKVQETEYAGHGKVLCNTLPLQAEGYDCIIAIGGDGTFHECVNGLLDRVDGEKCPIGLIPGGSGNSFMTDFRMQREQAQAMDNIISGTLAAIDATRVVFGPDESKHHVWSINVIGYTADQCMGAVNIDGWRGLLGTARYDVCGLWGLLKGVSSDVSVTVDGKPFLQGVGALFINTTQHFGKAMRAAPSALLDDGRGDIACVNGTRGEILRIFDLLPTGQHTTLVNNAQGSEFELTLPVPQGLFNVDGEVFVFHHNKIRAKVFNKHFEFYVPTKEIWNKVSL